MSISLAENGALQPPATQNERVLHYAPDSPERLELQTALDRMTGEEADLPLVIDGREVRTGNLEVARMPHAHGHTLGHAHLAGPEQVRAAIDAAARAWPDWSRRPWTERAAVFLRAADLLSTRWRSTLNAATMLGQSKTAHQAEVDSAAELIDFWRFNVEFMQTMYAQQPRQAPGAWTRVDYRPLEGFVYAVTPFNFTAIAGNLPGTPALLGNTVVWKPSNTAKYSAHFIMRLLEAAGLPPGVINLVYGEPNVVSDTVLADPTLAGINFTGSTTVFSHLLRSVSERSYRSYPRVVGETGGKNFIVAHPSAELEALTTAIIRGAFEYQGQKCSAASRLFVPESLWPSLRERLCDEIAVLRMGDVRDFRNFMGAVIDERAWRKHAAVIAQAHERTDVEVLAGGVTDMSVGFFVRPTLLHTDDPRSRFMSEEFFGPIASACVYPDSRFEETLRTIDAASAYGLTGSVFSTDRAAIASAAARLRHSAGNLYINDKPTGAVVGQQPFGGSRASGTNDKAGSIWNLIRWVSPRTLKETFDPPRQYAYPFMAEQ